ncbi:hypothetical protein D4764_18G0010520 [Takifugu flavidus]|uniref:Uncharacterized protein n=1 Tax=Takifugu flavidus TaxID=433684 RepID=A0A5C6NTD8_9TELE|nr:hypothetical protein D4764_18G0010520 [Takifugu flavidus]
MTENNEMESGEAQLQRSPSTASIQPMPSKASTRSSEHLKLSYILTRARSSLDLQDGNNIPHIPQFGSSSL